MPAFTMYYNFISSWKDFFFLLVKNTTWENGRTQVNVSEMSKREFERMFENYK